MRSRQELFAQSCDIAVRHGQFRMAWIGRVDRAAQQVIPMAISGTTPDFFDDIAGRLSYADQPSGTYSLTATVVRERRALVCELIEGDPRVLLPAKLKALSVASMAVLPLLVADEVVGVMALFSDEASFFDATEMKLLGELAGDISFALDHLEKSDRLNYLAYYDDITTLPNRTLFLDRVNQHRRARDGHRPHASPFLGVALIDVNRFRIVNDTLGRSLGDELLKLVAQRLQRHAGAMDMLARIGANSFGVAVCDARDASAVAVAVDHLVRACFDEPFQLGTQELRITAKAGVALFPLDGGDA
jgi:diguanylate cyclase (GGDEF)-like protein